MVIKNGRRPLVFLDNIMNDFSYHFLNFLVLPLHLTFVAVVPPGKVQIPTPKIPFNVTSAPKNNF